MAQDGAKICKRNYVFILHGWNGGVTVPFPANSGSPQCATQVPLGIEEQATVSVELQLELIEARAHLVRSSGFSITAASDWK